MSSIVVTDFVAASNAPPGTVIGLLYNKDASGNNIPSAFTLTSNPNNNFFISNNELCTAWTTPLAAGQYPISISAIGSQIAAANYTITVTGVMPTLPSLAISPDGSILTAGSGGSLTNSAGVWTFGTTAASGGYLILLNGASAKGGSALKLQVNNGGKIYATNKNNILYVWNGTSWVAIVPTAVTFNPATLSLLDTAVSGTVLAKVSVKMADGSVFAGTLTVSPPTIVGMSGTNVVLNRALTSADVGTATWTATATQNGTSVTGSLPVTIAAPAPPPPPPPPPLSTDGSILLQGSTGSLQTTDGTWTFEGTTNAIDLNGSRAANGSGNKLEVANGGKMYTVGTDSKWWVWTGASWTATGVDGSSPPPGSSSPPPPPPPPPPPGGAPTPTGITFVLPASIPDNSPVGTVLATATVAMSDGSVFKGTLSTNDTTGFFAVSGLNIVAARALTAADDGTHNTTVTATTTTGATASFELRM